MRDLRVLIGAQEVGAANALVPVLRELRRRGVTVEVVACLHAVPVFEAAGAPVQVLAVPEGDWPQMMAAARQMIERQAPDVLVLGTSWGATLDKALLQAADDRGVTTVSVVDAWTHYRERFTDPVSGTLRLPTRVLVPDERAQAQAVQAGLPIERLLVAGHPHLDRLATALQHPELRAEAALIRRRWIGGAADDPGTRIVLFLSEPFSHYHGPGSVAYYGYTEVEALEGLVDAVEALERQAPYAVQIVVKLHPRQVGGQIALGPSAVEREVLIVDHDASWPCLFAADAVVGMSSSLLLEAAIAGRPAISFRPTASASASFIGSELGAVPTAGSAQELAALLGGVLTPSGPALGRSEGWKRSVVRGDAAQRIADLALGLAT